MSAPSPFLPSSGSDFIVKKMFEIEVWTQLVEKNNAQVKLDHFPWGFGVKVLNSLSSASLAWGKKMISGIHLWCFAGANLPPWSKDDVKLSLLWAFHVEAWFRSERWWFFASGMWRFLVKEMGCNHGCLLLAGGGVIVLLKTGSSLSGKNNQ